MDGFSGYSVLISRFSHRGQGVSDRSNFRSLIVKAYYRRVEREMYPFKLV